MLKTKEEKLAFKEFLLRTCQEQLPQSDLSSNNS